MILVNGMCLVRWIVRNPVLLRIPQFYFRLSLNLLSPDLNGKQLSAGLKERVTTGLATKLHKGCPTSGQPLVEQEYFVFSRVALPLSS